MTGRYLAPTPLAKAATEWVTGRRLRGEIVERSAEVHFSRLHFLFAIHGDRPVAELDRKTLLAWQARTGRQAAGTRRAALSTVRVFCKWLIVEGYIESDPTAGLPRIREPRTVPRALAAADVARLREAMSGRPDYLATPSAMRPPGRAATAR